MSDQGRTLLGLLDSMSESSLRELLRQLLQEHPEWLEAYLLDEINLDETSRRAFLYDSLGRLMPTLDYETYHLTDFVSDAPDDPYFSENWLLSDVQKLRNSLALKVELLSKSHRTELAFDCILFVYEQIHSIRSSRAQRLVKDLCWQEWEQLLDFNPSVKNQIFSKFMQAIDNYFCVEEFIGSALFKKYFLSKHYVDLLFPIFFKKWIKAIKKASKRGRPLKQSLNEDLVKNYLLMKSALGVKAEDIEADKFAFLKDYGLL